MRRVFRRKIGIVVGWCIAASVALAPTPARAVGQFDIHLDPGADLANNPDALASFERAAQAWEAVIASPIRINISADVKPFNSTTIIGSTGFTGNLNLAYDPVRNAMAARASRPGNAILAALPTSAQISASVPATGSFDNTTMGITRANQKALGLIADPLTNTDADGIVQFNSNFTFDYDSRDGIDPGKFDFETAATHEIGHVLGFLSDTDDFDFDLFTQNDNVTTLDLFRFTKGNLPKTPQQFTSFPREMRPGVEAAFTDLLSEIDMSTGFNHGDGRQASHWKDDFIFDPVTGTLTVRSLIGVMDPTLPPRTTELISAADLRAFELIGYDVVPEPAGALTLACIGGFACLRRSRARRGSHARA